MPYSHASLIRRHSSAEDCTMPVAKKTIAKTAVKAVAKKAAPKAVAKKVVAKKSKG
jgi:hypothetical protein